MKQRQGDMWSAFDSAELFLVTTNSFTRNDGALVMGRGIALETKERFPEFPYRAGEWLKVSGLRMGKYGLLLPYADTDHPLHKLGCFQVKYHFKEAAELDLIQYSVELLNQLVEEDSLQDVHLNFPGIGAGQLRYDDVLPVVSRLSDHVTLWTK